MSILHVTFNDNTVTVMRSENPNKTFGDDDCPNGTESVIYKVAKMLKHSAGENCQMISGFSDSDISTKVSTQVATLDVETPADYSDIENHW